MSGPIKIFVIDDSAVVRTTITHLVENDKNISLIGSATDPIAAEEKFKRVGWPDVIILDIEMPRMDGLTFLGKLMQEHPTPVIICSSVAQKGSKNAIEALSLGAVEVIAKPEVGVKEFFLEEIREEFLRAIHSASKAKMRASVGVKKSTPTLSSTDLEKNSADVMLSLMPGVKVSTHSFVAIGSSTGGVQILEQLLTALPSQIPPVVITQHMPPGFTKSLADRLNKLCKVSVKEAEHGDKLLHGRVLIAPGDRHMMVKRQGSSYIVELKDGPKVSRHKPSVDVLFRSCANEAGSNAIGIILTGMGDDGAKGLKEMKERGARTYAQDEKSCIVYGMPKEAVAIGAVERTSSIPEIIEIIKRG